MKKSIPLTAVFLFVLLFSCAHMSEGIERPSSINNMNDINNLNLYIVPDYDKYGFINDKCQLVINCSYEAVSNFKEGLACVRTGGLWGFIDKKGGIVIQPRYFEIQSFSQDLAWVKMFESGRYGLIDRNGFMVLNDAYQEARPFHDGFSLVKNGEMSGFISKKNVNNFISRYYDGHSFSEGLAAVKTMKDGNFGFINTNMVLVIPPQFESTGDFSEGLASVLSGGKYGFINTAGKVVIECKYDEVFPFSDGLALVRTGSEYSYIDGKGDTEISAMIGCLQALPFSEGLAGIQMKYFSDQKWGFINKNAKIVIPVQFDAIENFYNGLARVLKNGKIGFIDKTGVDVCGQIDR